MLVCNNVACRYDRNTVFEGVSFNVNEGSLIVLHGHNGTGKTSLLEMLAGLAKPYDGEIMWDETPIIEAIRNGEMSLNYVGHKPLVKPELTVLENMTYWAKLAGDEKYIPYAISRFGLSNYVNHKCSELSKGWQKRVALSRLLFSDAELWVLDEPYNNLDHEISKLLDELVVERCKSGGIVILSSHMYVPIEFAIKINISDFAPKQLAA